MRLLRTSASAALAFAFTACYAQQTQIQLSAFPAMSVADARSTTTITAVVRDSRGNTVPDGTRVSFESSLGQFREAIVKTSSGIARAVLQAGGLPGTATIKVSVLDLPSNPTTMEFEFVGDRSMLNTAMEYIEMVSPRYMEFVPDQRVMAAAAPEHGVYIKYRDVTITADDVQVNIPRYEVRARKATLKIGKLSQDFDELYFNLKDRSGIGSTKFMALLPCPITLLGTTPVFLADDPERYKLIGQPVERWGLVHINRDVITPATGTENAYKMRFEELGAKTSITAKKAVIFPQKEIQFQRAEIMVTGNKVMQMPLYQLNLMQAQSGSVISSLVNINNNQVNVNYPYYLSLKPGQTSLLRFRTGERYGRGISASGGAFLDYELNWNRGDEMDGKLTIGAIGRKDWTIGIQQYLRVDDRTTAFGMVEMPANQSIYGSANISRSYNGFQVSLNGSANQNLRGIRYLTQSYSFVAEKDPTKLGKLPVRLYFGLTAQQDSNSFTHDSQSAVGLRARLQSMPLRIDDKTTVYAGMSVAHLSGRNTLNGLTTTVEASVNRQIGNNLTLQGTYNFVRDGYNDRFLGTQRVGLEARYYSDRFILSLIGSRSLDIDRFSLYGDMSLNVLGNWWISSGYTMDKYLGYQFLDYSLGLGYRIGGREIGVVWSRSTKRIGLQLLGAAF